MSTPVIFLCFANEYHEGRYLDNLVQEYKNLYSVLAPISPEENTADSSNILCEIVVRQNVSIGDIVDVFQNKMYRGRIAIFHYGGHADGYQLLLEGKDGENKAAHGSGLVSLLSKQDNLKLVFLNGCSTQKMAQDLVARGVPAVIGTATSIADDVALNLSERFYKGLAQGLTLAGAWETAKDEVRTFMDSPSNYRSLYMAAIQVLPDRFPWDIEYRDDAAKEVFAKWNLPDVASQPLFGLPPIAGKGQLPPSPFLFLKPYESQHAEIFFGRSYYIRDLYLKIAEPSSPPIILFYGESGAGKSSLLDAGLRPRLDAARNPEDPDQLTYEVHYQRRNAETGLVGTLSEMLSYTFEAEEAAGEEIVEEDPNARTLKEIEGLINQLEGEERDTLRGLIERHKAIKSVRSKSQQKKNLYEGGELKAHTGVQLRATWANIEKMTGKRLILILDQVEEAFARPLPDMPNELEDFLQIMKEIWATPDSDEEQAIRGRIILGYREEFNARIEARIKDFELSRTTVFLEHLQRKDILDIFAGLQSEVVRQNYNVQIEPNLPERVADDLLKGRTSTGPGQAPVAPVLQLLLTKMWNKAYRENSHEPYFSLDAYNAVQSQGREMEEFFFEQLGKVYQWDADVVDTGLVLDILQYHITDLGTSGRRHIDDIRSRYRHLSAIYEDRPNLIYNLIEKLKEVFLLVDNSRGFTSLPHDTLAPIIMREYNRSDKLGQRSTRILDTKLPDFEQADDKHKSKVRLDDNDLAVVEGGVLGMRALSDTEYQLLEISKVEREKRLRLRGQLIQGGLITGVIIVLLALMAGSLSVNMLSQLKEAAIIHAHEESLGSSTNAAGTVQDKQDSVKKGLTSYAYLEPDKKRTDVIENLYGLANKEIANSGNVRLFHSIESGSGIKSLDYQPGIGVVGSFKIGRAAMYPINSEPLRKFEIGPIAKNVLTDVHFTADGKNIQVTFFNQNFGSLEYGKLSVYYVDGKLLPAPLIPISIRHKDPDFSANDAKEGLDSDYLDYVDSDGSMYIGLYDCFSGTLTDYGGNTYGGEGVSNLHDRYIDYSFFNTTSGDTVDLWQLFKMKLWDRSKERITKDEFQHFKAQLTELGISADNQGQLTYEYEDALEATDSTWISCKGTKLGFVSSYNFQVRNFTGNILTRPEQPIEGIFYFNVLNKDHFLTLEPDEEGSSNTAIIRQIDDFAPLFTISHKRPILEIKIMADRAHFITLSEDEAKMWTFKGQLIDSTALQNIQIQPSRTGSRFIAYNESRLELWSGKKGEAAQIYRIKSDGEMRLTKAHFIPGDSLHLALGIIRNGSAGNTQQDSVLYWNISDETVGIAFQIESEYNLLDMKISKDGAKMVAWVKENGKHKLVFYPGESVSLIDQIGAGAPFTETKDVTPIGIDINDKERILFAPQDSNTFVYDSKENTLEVYDISGEKKYTYELKEGFKPGFNDSIPVTPDGKYLFAHNENHALFWTLDPQHITAIEKWAGIQKDALSFDSKKDYNLDMPIDQVPGHNDTNRILSIVLLVLAFLYIIIRATNYFYTAVTHKDYRKAGLYGLVFGLFSVLLSLLWDVSSIEDDKHPFLLFVPVIAALILAAPELIEQLRTEKVNIKQLRAGKLNKIVLNGGISLLFAGGLTAFIWGEWNSGEKGTLFLLFQSLLIIAIFGLLLVLPTYFSLQRRSQNRIRGYYNWQLPIVISIALFAWLKLYFALQQSDSSSFPDLLLLLLCLIGGCWMAIRQYRIYRTQGKMLARVLYGVLAVYFLFTLPSSNTRLFSNIILLGTLSLLIVGYETTRHKTYTQGFWITSAGLVALVGMITSTELVEHFGILGKMPRININPDDQLFGTLKFQDWAMWLILIPLGMYGIRYFLNKNSPQQQANGSPWLFRIGAIALAILLFSIDDDDQLFGINVKVFAMLMVLVPLGMYGIRYFLNTGYQQQAKGSPWLFRIAAIGLAIWLFSIGDNDPLFDIVNAVALAMLMVLLPLGKYGIRYFLNTGYQQQAKDSPWLSHIGAIGLAIWLGMMVMKVPTETKEVLPISSIKAPEVPTETNDVSGDTPTDQDIEGEKNHEDSPPDKTASAELDSTLAQGGDTLVLPGKEPEILRIAEPQDLVNIDSVFAEEEPATKPAIRSALPVTSPGEPNNRQLHILALFGPEKEVHNQVLEGLLRSYAHDPKLLPELILYNYENSGINEGIWNTLYLLERLPDEVLMSQQEMVAEYLDWTAQLGYGPSTMERIGGIQLRVQP